MNRHRAAALLRELASEPEILLRLAEELDAPDDAPPPKARRAKAIRQPEIRRVDTSRVTDEDRARAEAALRRAGMRVR
jgi:hypothetical protein